MKTFTRFAFITGVIIALLAILLVGAAMISSWQDTASAEQNTTPYNGASPAQAGTTPCDGVTSQSTPEVKAACKTWLNGILAALDGDETITPEPGATKVVTGTNVVRFGSGTCMSAGVSYPVDADEHNVWNSPKLLKALAQSGGTCTVTTLKPGFLWSEAFGTISRDGQTVERGRGMKAPAGTYLFTYTVVNNPSNGFVFHETYPVNTEANDAYAMGECVIDGKSYTLSADKTAIWQDGEVLKQLWAKGGKCNVTVTRPGWYYSVNGDIAWNGKKMANGSGLIAMPGQWTFEYTGASENNGFIVRDNLPYQ